MFKVNKNIEPSFFIKFKRQNNNKILNWNSMNEYPNIKKELREYMLSEEQAYQCPYCETKIESGEDGNIEHIKPKDIFGNLFMDYNNLITSCKSSYSCDNYKGNQWDIDFINPVVEDPEEYFIYSMGEIIPKEQNGKKYEKALKTIEILNLNHSKLVRIRQTILENIKKIPLDILEDLSKVYYPSLLKFYIKNI